MLPDFTIRLNNLIKAMEKTIIPAIDCQNGMAQEQAALVIGHLNVLKEQIDGAYLYECGSYRNMLALASSLLEGADESASPPPAVSALQDLVRSQPSELPLTPVQVNAFTTILGQAVEDLINNAYKDGSNAFKQHVFNTVLNYNGKQSARERIWFKGNNLDPDTSDLGSMDEMLFTRKYLLEKSPS